MRDMDLALEDTRQINDAIGVPLVVDVLSLTVAARQFPARPSLLPDVRDFLRMQLATTPLSGDQIGALRQRVAEHLLDMAGTGVTIQISVRLVRRCVEIDVIRITSHSRTGAVYRLSVAEGETVSCGVAIENEPDSGPSKRHGQDSQFSAFSRVLCPSGGYR